MLEKEQKELETKSSESRAEQSALARLRQRNPLMAGSWATASFIISNMLGALLFIPLARLLNPADFGLYAEANIVYSGLTVVIELSLIRMLVRAPGNSAEIAQATFWLSLWAGIGGSVLCILASWPMSVIYNEPRLLLILIVLGPGIFATALGTVPYALLARELDFRRRLLPETISVGLAAIAALVLAFAGVGLFTLIIYPLIRTILSSLIAWKVVQWRPTRRPPDAATLKSLLNFALPTIGGEIMLYARFNIDYAIGGKLLGASLLGVYSLAWNTAERPAFLLNAFFKDAGYATFARLVLQPERLRQIFLSSVRVIATLALPGFGIVILLRQELVTVVFGSRWQAAVGPLMPLFILHALWVTFYPGGSLVLALGHSRIYALVNGFSLAGTVIAVLIGANLGVIELAWAMLLSSGATSLTWGGLACRYLQITLAEIIKTFQGPVLLTILTLLAVIIGQKLGQSLPDIGRLLMPGLVGLVTFAGCARFLIWQQLRQDLAQLGKKI